MKWAIGDKFLGAHRLRGDYKKKSARGTDILYHIDFSTEIDETAGTLCMAEKRPGIRKN